MPTQTRPTFLLSADDQHYVRVYQTGVTIDCLSPSCKLSSAHMHKTARNCGCITVRHLLFSSFIRRVVAVMNLFPPCARAIRGDFVLVFAFFVASSRLLTAIILVFHQEYTDHRRVRNLFQTKCDNCQHHDYVSDNARLAGRHW